MPQVDIRIQDAVQVCNGSLTVENVQNDPIPCDFYGNGIVDITDINAILAVRNTPASGLDGPRDIDGDGVITVLDARKCVP